MVLVALQLAARPRSPGRAAARLGAGVDMPEVDIAGAEIAGVD